MSDTLKIVLSLEELSTCVQLSPDIIIELIELHLLIPEGKNKVEWRFDEISLKRAKIASNLQRDLEINTPGLALAVELLEKIEKLESEINRLQKIFE